LRVVDSRGDGARGIICCEGMESGSSACLVLVRVFFGCNGLKHRGEIIKVEFRHVESLLLKTPVYDFGGVSR
jgi:hypothetical protein